MMEVSVRRAQHGNPPGLFNKSPEEQAQILSDSFFSSDARLPFKLPLDPTALPDTDGWLVALKYQSLADSYTTAMEILLQKIRKTQGLFFQVAEEEAFGKKFLTRLRPNDHTLKKLCAMAERQPGDFLTFPVKYQDPEDHRYSTRCNPALTEVLLPLNQFLLDPFSVGCLILTHPAIFDYHRGLIIDCPGYTLSHEEPNSQPHILCYSYCHLGQKLMLSHRPFRGKVWRHSTASGLEV